MVEWVRALDLKCGGPYSLNLIVSLSVRATGLTDKQPKKEVLVAVKAPKHGSSKEQKDEFFLGVSVMSILTHSNIVHRSL